MVCLGYKELEHQALANARADAESQPVPQLPPMPGKPKPKRTRYWPDNRLVDLIDFAFGVALWTPYDPQFNAVVKGWARLYMGRWQPNHKNWLFPVEAKQYLVAEISQRQTRPPTKVF